METHPSWGAALVDLRLHGDSTAGFEPPHTVRAAAADVLDLMPELPGPVEALVGHSLGGKLVLAMQRASGQRFPRAVVLDASPSPRPDRLGAEQSREILHLLAGDLRLPKLERQREALVAGLMPEDVVGRAAARLPRHVFGDPARVLARGATLLCHPVEERGHLRGFRLTNDL